MGIQPTGSRSALLLQCPHPFDPATEIPPQEIREAPRYGLAYHYVMSRVVPKAIARRKVLLPKPALVTRALLAQGIASDAVRVELLNHVVESLRLLIDWLRDNEFGIDFLTGVEGGFFAAEEPLAIELAMDGVPGAALTKVRRIAPPDENHNYDVSGPNVIPTTLDLRMRAPRRRGSRAWSLIVDYKTGRRGDWSQPAKVPQMMTGALAEHGSERHGDAGGDVKQVFLAVLDANRAGISTVYADEATADDRWQHQHAMTAALGRIGSGFLRTGPECDFCPARSVCPTQWKNIVEEGHAIVKATVGGLEGLARRDDLGPLEKAGALHQAFSYVAKLERKVKPEIKKLVEAGQVVTRPDGQILALRPHNVERMPQKSDYEEKYGKARAEREFEKLRKRGLLVRKEEMWLEAEPNERIRR